MKGLLKRKFYLRGLLISSSIFVLQLMANGRNGHISNALLLADKDNETAKELVPTHLHPEAECTAQGITSKRKIVIMDHAQASFLNVAVHYLAS